MKKIISTTKAPAAIGPYSQAIEVSGTLYASGQIAINPATGNLVEGGIREQTVQVFQNIEAILSEAGYSLQNVVKTTVFITDMALFAELNGVYGEYFTANCPARSTVAVAALPKGALVEIEVTAVG